MFFQSFFVYSEVGLNRPLFEEVVLEAEIEKIFLQSENAMNVKGTFDLLLSSKSSCM